MKRKSDKLNKLHNFELWVMLNSDRIRDLFTILPNELVQQLDYSLNSLIVFEKYLLDNYTYDSIIMKSNFTLLDNLSRYVGEVARRHLKDAKWDIYLENKKNIHYNIPLIVAPHIFAEQFCPIYTVTAALDRKHGNFLQKAVQDCIDRQIAKT
ncbi:MAG: hypothetical protein RL329_983 [Bacteroidota bacterium]